MVEEVEAAVNPQAVFLNRHIFLRVDGPLAWVGYDAPYVGVDLRHRAFTSLHEVCWISRYMYQEIGGEVAQSGDAGLVFIQPSSGHGK